MLNNTSTNLPVSGGAVLETLMVLVLAVANSKQSHRQNRFPTLGFKNRGVRMDNVKSNSFNLVMSTFLFICVHVKYIFA